ncbi:hypothetical protein JXB02_04560 [Candidatus Woesearchaeota archaeon]|nr:hypothetical protein [Candidatus Woesearchaeota archaeon]
MAALEEILNGQQEGSWLLKDRYESLLSHIRKNRLDRWEYRLLKAFLDARNDEPVGSSGYARKRDEAYRRLGKRLLTQAKRWGYSPLPDTHLSKELGDIMDGTGGREGNWLLENRFTNLNNYVTSQQRSKEELEQVIGYIERYLKRYEPILQNAAPGSQDRIARKVHTMWKVYAETNERLNAIYRQEEAEQEATAARSLTGRIKDSYSRVRRFLDEKNPIPLPYRPVFNLAALSALILGASAANGGKDAPTDPALFLAPSSTHVAASAAPMPDPAWTLPIPDTGVAYVYFKDDGKLGFKTHEQAFWEDNRFANRYRHRAEQVEKIVREIIPHWVDIFSRKNPRDLADTRRFVDPKKARRYVTALFWAENSLHHYDVDEKGNAKVPIGVEYVDGEKVSVGAAGLAQIKRSTVDLIMQIFETDSTDHLKVINPDSAVYGTSDLAINANAGAGIAYFLHNARRLGLDKAIPAYYGGTGDVIDALDTLVKNGADPRSVPADSLIKHVNSPERSGTHYGNTIERKRRLEKKGEEKVIGELKAHYAIDSIIRPGLKHAQSLASRQKISYLSDLVAFQERILQDETAGPDYVWSEKRLLLQGYLTLGDALESSGASGDLVQAKAVYEKAYGLASGDPAVQQALTRTKKTLEEDEVSPKIGKDLAIGPLSSLQEPAYTRPPKELDGVKQRYQARAPTKRHYRRQKA